MPLLGIDLGSSSVKASILDEATGQIVGSAQYPEREMAIDSPQHGWAEQDPAAWWDNTVKAVKAALAKANLAGDAIKAVGIAYQMHGLVCLDENDQPLRPSIIWCDSRAVGVGQEAYDALGHDRCLTHLLNSPGNFTAAKLGWVKQNEPDVFNKIKTICLPGDYLAAKLTGKVATTVSGLSEGIFWDFKQNQPADFLLEQLGIDAGLLADLVPTFGDQGQVNADAAQTLGLKVGTPVTYRAGDQPNNALSLNVLNPGEVAATAGTSGVVYAVGDTLQHEPKSRTNGFAHVNHAEQDPRVGMLLCINGTGIANAWTRRLVGDLEYTQLNELAEKAPVGCDGLTFLPFGNGAERMLQNQDIGARISGIDFNRHTQAHIARAVQEGIVYSFAYGIGLLKKIGIDASVIRAGHTNMFLSETFRQTLANAAGCEIELYDTDGSAGAARGAGIGAGIFKQPADAFASLEKVGQTIPNPDDHDATIAALGRWKQRLAEAMH